MKRFSYWLIAALVLSLVGPAELRAETAEEREARFRRDEVAKILAGLAVDDPEAQYLAIDKLRGFKAHAELLKELGAVAKIVAVAEKTRWEHLAQYAGETLRDIDAAGAVEHLKGRRKASSASIARNRLAMLRFIGTASATEFLWDSFKDSGSAAVRFALVRAIGELKITAGRSYLMSALAAKDTALRNAAAIAAGKLGDPTVAPALISKLDDSDEFHGYFCAWALGRLDSAEAFGQVSGMIGRAKGSDEFAKALDLTARESDVPALIGHLKSSKTDTLRIACCTALGRLAKDNIEAQEVLLKVMLQDTDEGVRGAAFDALGKIATTELGPSLMGRIGQRKSPELRRVYELLGDLSVKAAAKPLMSRIFKERRDPFVWQTAAIAFWKVGDREAMKKFEQFLIGASNRDVIVRGVEALSFRRNPAGFRLLIDLLRKYKDRSPEQYAVEKGLERMTGHFYGPSYGIWRRWFEDHPEFFTKKQTDLDRKKWREDFDKENKGFRQTEETEAAVQRGLRWLVRHQQPDGSWDPQLYRHQCDDGGKCGQDGARFELDPVGTTGLVALAFLGAGYSPDSGKYSDALARSLEYIMARQRVDGNYLNPDLIGGYNRPTSCIALAEAFQMTRDERYRFHAERGAHFIQMIQNAIGGWRYRVKINTTDTSCASWNLFALKTAAKAGVPVREMAFEGVRAVFELYSSPVDGDQREQYIPKEESVYALEVGKGTTFKFWSGYQNSSYPDSKYATVSLGLMTRIFLGYRRSHPFCVGSANAILEDFMEEIPKGENWSKYRSRREYPTYAWYYGTLAMHQMGGRYFREWNDRIKKIVPGTQDRGGCLDGSWPVWAHDTVAGRLYTTAMAVLTLETYYRYLPVLED